MPKQNGANGEHVVTMREVAKAAGVSIKTVSNVVNDYEFVSQATRDKVNKAIDELGYALNVSARNLNRGKTGFITLAVPTLTAPYLSELANRVIDAARGYGYSVYVTTYAEGSAQGAQSLLRNFNTTVSDGMILSISEVENLEAADLDVDYPLVCVGARSTHGKADHVTPDDIQEARLAAEYLFDHGATRLAVVGSRTEPEHIDSVREAVEGNAQLRLRGVLEACAARGAAFDSRLVMSTGQDWTIGSGARITQQLIDSGIPFDGIVAFNDQLALGALFTLAANGISVPEQMQVIGFDNIEEAAYFQPPLTTMDSCLDWIAPTAVSRILDRIDGTRVLEPSYITTQSHVIARATTRV